MTHVTGGRERFGGRLSRNNSVMAGPSRGARRLGQLAGFAVRRRRWVVAGWLLLAGVLTLAVPRLEDVVARDSTPFLPPSSPSISAFEHMDAAFGAGDGESIAFVVLADDGFAHDDADQAYYRQLVQRLRSDDRHIADLQDYATRPQLREALLSEDGDATYLPIAMRHPVGSPTGRSDVDWLREQVAHGKPDDVTGYVTGDVASIADMSESIENSIALVTVVTVVIIIVILLLLYRSLIVPLVPLATIGVALMVARALVSLMGESFLPVSTFTGTFVTALVLGAGTDYTVFLISRFHESMRDGTAAAGSVVEAIRRIGPVVVASGFTVIIGSAAMVFAALGLFNTTGPAIAVAVAVTLAVGLTLTPALMAMLGDRIAPKPRPAGRSRWYAVGAMVARRPGPLLLASTLFLLALAAFWPTLTPTYDTRSLIPASMPSAQGYETLGRHFPDRELNPDYVLLDSDHDMRTTRDLAVLDQVAASLAKVPGVTGVRGVTRPQGEPIPQAQLPNQLDDVGRRLGAAEDKLRGGGSGVDRLSDGAQRLSGGADRISDGTDRATDAVDQFLAGLARERSGLSAAVDGAGDAQAGADALRAGAFRLADGAARRAQADQARGARPRHDLPATLSNDSICTDVDQICNTSRIYLGRIWRGERDQLLPGLAQAADAAERIGRGDGDLASGLGEMQDGLRKARAGIDRLESGEREFRRRLSQLSDGADALAAGAAKLPPGVHRLKRASDRLADGLARASSYLTGTADSAQAADISAFYLPASALDDPRFALARDYYLSDDGRTARFMVFTKDNDSRIGAERDAVDRAVTDTPLAGSPVAVTGPHGGVRRHPRAGPPRPAARRADDAGDRLRHPRAAAAGARRAALPAGVRGALVRRGDGRHRDRLAAPARAADRLHHTTAGVRDPRGGRRRLQHPPDVAGAGGVGARDRARASRARSAATGGVITSAGLIFAGTFVAMLSSPVLGLKETGFAIAPGSCSTRSSCAPFLVPSAAALLGRWNWWPSDRRGSRSVSAVLGGLRRRPAAAGTDRDLARVN